MKRIQTERSASQRAAEPRKRHPLFFLLMLCAVLTVGTTISAALLGGSLSRYSKEKSSVIALVPEEGQLEAAEEKDLATTLSEEGPKRSESPAAPSETPTPRSVTAPGSATTYRRMAPAGSENTAARTSEYQGELRIYDAAKSWSAETQVDLFKKSYNESGSETVKAEDGSKVIAPGTSNFYSFTLENNGNLPLDYTISLKVEDYGEGTENKPEIPLEWRLLAGDGAALSDWRGYTETAEVMKQTKLDARRQDNYTIEWRWDYERGDETDEADTALGDLAALQALGAKATIIVYAEQNTEPIPDESPDVNEGPSDVPDGGQNRPAFIPMWPKTGDTSNLLMYIVLMSVSGGGLLILLRRERLRKKRE